MYVLLSKLWGVLGTQLQRSLEFGSATKEKAVCIFSVAITHPLVSNAQASCSERAEKLRKPAIDCNHTLYHFDKKSDSDVTCSSFEGQLLMFHGLGGDWTT